MQRRAYLAGHPTFTTTDIHASDRLVPDPQTVGMMGKIPCCGSELEASACDAGLA